jgi:hypothetical protein
MFGLSVAGLNDVSGDGRGDIAVGAPAEDPGASPDGCGRTYIYNGATGALRSKVLPPAPATAGGFGSSVAGIPDLNGDARGDLAIGAPGESPSGSKSGRAYIYSGSTAARLFTLISPYPEASGAFGASVGGVPDANGNGKGETLVGAPKEDPGPGPADTGRAYLIKK